MRLLACGRADKRFLDRDQVEALRRRRISDSISETACGQCWRNELNIAAIPASSQNIATCLGMLINPFSSTPDCASLCTVDPAGACANSASRHSVFILIRLFIGFPYHETTENENHVESAAASPGDHGRQSREPRPGFRLGL